MPSATRTSATFLLLSAFGLSAPSGADVLDTYRWEHRLLVVVAPSTNDSALKKQRARAARDAGGWVDRRLRLLEIVAGVMKENGVVIAAEVDPVLDRLRLDQERFSAVLIGLDGTVKLRQASPVSNQFLFSLIDAMPMRREELRLRDER